MNLYDLDTPALVVDLDIVERNIARMAAIARDGGKAHRPHTKTHKTPEIARMQVAAGARGLTVAKVGEAEVMADAGFGDLFIAHQVVGAAKLERLMALLRRARVIVGVDSVEVAAPLDEAARQAGVTVPVRIEVDTGIGRAGVRTVEQAVRLGEKIARMPGLALDGLFTYEGDVNAGDEAQRRATCGRAADKLRQAAAGLAERGVEAGVLSVGSTAGAPIMAREPGIGELRAGVYVFNDCGQMGRGATAEECALTVLATVVSRPDERTAILDAGTKALSGDRAPEGSRHGRVLEDASVLFDWANEEHGHLDLSNAALRPKVGDKLRVVPYHACTATNMHDALYGVRGERVEQVWTIAARGKLQ